MIDWQRYVFETCPFGPMWAALLSGYAVWIEGQIYLTPYGEAYLASLD